MFLWILFGKFWLWVWCFSWFKMNGLSENFILFLWGLFFISCLSCSFYYSFSINNLIRCLSWNRLNGKFTLRLWKRFIFWWHNTIKNVLIFHTLIMFIFINFYISHNGLNNQLLECIFWWSYYWNIKFLR